MKAEDLKKSILQQAIQGKLVAQDPNDEPATVLLERIREEKEQLIKEKKIKRDKNESYIFRGEDNSHYEKIGSEVRCIDDEIPLDIPDSWAWCRLGSVCSINPRNTDIDNDLEVSFIAMKDIVQGYSSNYSYENKYWGNIRKGFTHFAKGDIGIAKITPCFQNRKSSIFTELKNDIGAGTTELHILRAHINDIANYILTVCKTEYFISYGVSKFTGTAGQQRVPTQALIDLLIPFPPLVEQKRIFNRIKALEPLLIAYDKLEKEDTLFDITLPNALNKSILQYAIQGKLVSQDLTDEPASVLLERIYEEKKRLVKEKKVKADKNESFIYKGDDNSYYEVVNNLTTCIDDQIPFEIPESWEWVRLGSIATLCGGFAFKSTQFCENGMRVIRISDFDENGFKSHKIVRYTYSDPLSNYLLEKNNILMAMTGGTVGKSYLVKDLPEPMLINQRVAGIKISNNINSTYIDSVVKSPLTIGVINDAKNSTNDNISMSDIYNFLIPLPPLEEQDRLVNKLVEMNYSLSNILLL